MSFSFSEPGTALFPSSPTHAGADWQQSAASKLASVACLPARSDVGARPDSQPNAAGGGSQTRSVGTGLVSSSTTEKYHPLPDPRVARMKRMKFSVLTAARLHREAVTEGGFRGRWAFVTLTYAGVSDWNPEHMPAFLDHVRKWFHRRGFRAAYVWVAELQKRGAMHYHILVWLPKGLTLPKPDKQGWWRHGSTKIEWARNPVGYIVKYASKCDSTAVFPKGARIHGCGGLRGKQRMEARWWKRPGWLRRCATKEQTLKRRLGGGWIDEVKGLVFYSPWRVVDPSDVPFSKSHSYIAGFGYCLKSDGLWLQLKDGTEFDSAGRPLPRIESLNNVSHAKTSEGNSDAALVA